MLGRSCGGFSSKLHATVDALGYPIKFILTGGEESDSPWAVPLVTDFQCSALLADKGYDTNDILDFLKQRGTVACIPPKRNRIEQRSYDETLYKERNLVERLFNKLKHYRRLATRYDKTASAYLGFVYLAASMLWLA